jgi:hypothetical protein
MFAGAGFYLNLNTPEDDFEKLYEYISKYTDYYK